MPVLVAPLARLRDVAVAVGHNLESIELIDVPHSHAAAVHAATMAAAGEVGMLMQGSLAGGELLDAVRTRPELATERRLSHVFHADMPLYDRPLLIADALLHARPGLAEKADIVRNAVMLAHALGLARLAASHAGVSSSDVSDLNSPQPI